MTDTWRTGRRQQRSIYLQRGDLPTEKDQLIGVMDSPHLAMLTVVAVNTLQAVNPAEHERLMAAFHRETD
jgi:hypothetical protein